MTSSYPTQIDSSLNLSTVSNNSSPVSEEFVNNLRDAIVNVEAELGIKPSGLSGTVRARLDAMDVLIGILSDHMVTIGGDLTGYVNQTVIGLQGRHVNATAPTLNQTLAWNGVAWAPASITGPTGPTGPAGPAGSSGVSSVVFKPAGVSAGSVYATWAEIQTVIAATTTPLTVYIDSTGTGGTFSIPGVSGTTDCKGLVTFAAIEVPGTPPFVLYLEDGVVLKDVVAFESPWQGYFTLSWYAATTNRLDFTAGTSTSPTKLVLKNMVVQSDVTGSPLRDLCLTTGAGNYFQVEAESCSILGQAGEQSVFGCDGISGAFVTIRMKGPGSTTDAYTFSGGAITGKTLIYDRFLNHGTQIFPPTSMAALIEEAQPDAFVYNFPAGPIFANYTAHGGEYVPIDTSGGSFTLTLPSITAGDAKPGSKVIIKSKTNSTNPLTVAAAAGDTVEGGATDTFMPDAVKFPSTMYLAIGAEWVRLFS